MWKSTKSASLALTSLGLVGVLVGNASAASDSAKTATATDKLVADSLKGLNKSKLVYSFRDATVTLYGTAQLNVAWQNHRGNYAPADYVSYAGTGAAAQTGQWALTANASRLGVRYLVPAGKNGISYDGKIEGDFYGNLKQTTSSGAGTQNETAPLFQLRHAFASVNLDALGLKILAGQTVGLTGPLELSAAQGSDYGNQQINFNGLSGSGSFGNREPQLQIREVLGFTEPTKEKNATTLALAVAAARAVGNIQPYLNANSAPDAGEEADIPVFEGRAELSVPLWVTKKNAILGVAGHFQQQDFLDYNSSNAHTLNSWSFVSDLYLPLHKYVLVNFKYGFGTDLSSRGANIGQAVAFDTAKGVYTKFYRPEGQFGFATLRLNPHREDFPVTVNAGFGFDSVYASKLKPNTAARTRNTTAYVNALYYLSKFNYVGFEVSRIETDYLAKSATVPAVSERLWRYELVNQYVF